MNFEELTINKTYEEIDLINYFDLLKCDEWKNKRTGILKRDNFRCLRCKTTYTISAYSGNNKIYLFKDNSPNPDNKYINLQVHHTLYIYNKLPWEYEDDELETLCNICHNELHNNEDVKVWDENQYNQVKFGSCDRCSGKGYIALYKNIQNGMCFKCKGYGYNKPLINLNERLNSQKNSG